MLLEFLMPLKDKDLEINILVIKKKQTKQNTNKKHKKQTSRSNFMSVNNLILVSSVQSFNKLLSNLGEGEENNPWHGIEKFWIKMMTIKSFCLCSSMAFTI